MSETSGSLLLVDPEVGFTNELRAILDVLDQTVAVSNCPDGAIPPSLRPEDFKAVVVRFQRDMDRFASRLEHIKAIGQALPIIVVHDNRAGFQSLPDDQQILGGMPVCLNF